MRMWRRATGRRIASEATEQTMKTIIEPTVPAPSRAATAAATAASATGPRKKSPGVNSSPTPSATATSTQTSQPTLVDYSRGRAPRAARAGRRSDPGRPAYRPSRSTSTACIPTARAPSMSSSIVSPTIARLARGRRRAARACAGRSLSCGFVFPCAREVRTASTTSPWCSTNSIEVARGVREQPELQPAARSASSVGRTSSYSSKWWACSHAPSISAAQRVGVADPAHALDDPLREEDPDLLVVVELGVPLQRRERGAARFVVARGIELEAVPLAEPR